jgi:hypothetical protein
VAGLITAVFVVAAVFVTPELTLLVVVDGVAFGFAAALGSAARAGLPGWATAGFAAGLSAVAAETIGADRNKAHAKEHRFERVRVCMESMEYLSIWNPDRAAEPVRLHVSHPAHGGQGAG